MKLANIYIVNQEFEPCDNILLSLSKGSAWKNLYVPYKGENKLLPNTILNNLMALRFMMIELNLYIDTHPDDRDSIIYYNRLKKQYLDTLKKYDGDYNVVV